MALQQIKLVAYQLGEKINLKGLNSALISSDVGSLHSYSTNDIFINRGGDSFIYIQNSGEVAFSNCAESTIVAFLDSIKQYVINAVTPGKEYREDFEIEVNPGQPIRVHYNYIQLDEINADVIKIALLNVSQSVALDYFTEVSQGFLAETAVFTQELEQRGKLSITNTQIMKFIGKTLNTQNRIIDNLYFIDAPDTVWENEYLAQVNNSLAKVFQLKTRFNEVEYTLKIIDANLRTFSQLVQHRDNKKLELIVIFLILFEVIHALVGKYF